MPASPAGEISKALTLLFRPGQVIEVRAITDEGISSGYFNDNARLVETAEALDAVPAVQGIYVTLNEVDPALLSRRANRIKKRLGKKDATPADSDIIHRRWFPVDVDPVRPSGVSSSDEEHQAAISRAEEIAVYLTEECSWPLGILADSGNGAHLLYRIDLPNDDESRDLVKRCLEVLAAIFSTSESTIDTANYNAARIWKLYGTTSRKGDHTGDRPHRRSLILNAPKRPEVVPRELLERLAGALPSNPSPDARQDLPRPPGRTLVLGSWLRDHGIGVTNSKPYQGGTLFVLDTCPFGGAHTDGAFAIQFANGAIHAGCHHNSCGGGSQRWQEIREKFEPDRRKRQGERIRNWGRERVKGKAARDGFPLNRDQVPGITEAEACLQSGDPKKAMLTTFALDHEGDEVVAECLILSLASRSVVNTNGLHVSVTGESGKGKSHAFSTMLRQVPERFRLEGAMSNKALFYMDDLQAGSIIVLDDRALSEDMAEILKGVTTSFRKPFIYRTVSKDRRSQVCTIPERCVWWVAKVEGAGDDQVFNRMLTCWIDDSEEQDARVLARILARDVDLPDHETPESPEVQVCRAMWEILSREQLYVIIPYAPRIRFQAAANRRNPEMLLDLVKTNAVLRFAQREQTKTDTVVCITATRGDFDEAARLYGLLNGTAGGQTSKLTRREAAVLEVIEKCNWPEFTIPSLQRVTGLANASLHKIIHGYSSRGATYSGLLEKCPAIAYTDRTVVADDEFTGSSTRRRTNAYTFDRDLYRAWCTGGAVWIDEGSDSTNETDPCPASLLQCCSSPAAIAEGCENEPAASPAETGGDITHTYVCNGVSCNKSQDTQHHANDSHSLCDPKNAAGQNAISPDRGGIDEQHTQEVTRAYGNCGSGAEGCSSIAGQIDPHDFTKLPVLDWRPCSICGRKESWYIEKLTAERRANPTRDAQRLCKRCYNQAAARVRATIYPLAGTIDLSQFEEVGASVGRCSVCDLAGAAWIDRKAGIKLCQACYQREIGHIREITG